MAYKRVLIVDDEQRTLLFLREALLVSGIDVEIVCSSSPEAALEAFQRQAFDLLIVDICLVGMNGVELLHELRQLGPHLPAILVSGQSSASIEACINRLEAVYFLRKPFAFETFIAMAVRALNVSQPVDGSLRSSDSAGQEWRVESARRHLNNLLQDSGAHSVCLTDATGCVIIQVGGQILGLDQWAPPPDVGDGSFNFAYYQGRCHDIYSARVGKDVYLILTFDRNWPTTRIGQVLQYTRRTVQDLTGLL